jgi:hypothetical protein
MRNNVQIKQMKKQQSVFKMLGKLARIIGIAQRGETFSPEKVAPTCTQLPKTESTITYMDSFAGFHKESTEDRVPAR